MLNGLGALPPEEMQRLAQRLLSLGFVPLRVEPDSKAPKNLGWQVHTPTPDTLQRDFARPANIGLRMGDVQKDGTCLLAIDVDLENGELIRCVERAIGEPVPTKQGNKGFTYLLRMDRETKTGKIQWIRDKKKTAAIDILCRGAQTVIPPSIHPDTKLPYRWVSGQAVETLDYRTLPVFSPALLDEIRGFCKNSDDPIYALNDMEWAGVGGGGNTHDTCLAAVASMVARKWTDEDIQQRIGRAKREACEAASMPYNWPEAQKVIQEWTDSSRAKGFGEAPQPRQKSQGQYADDFVHQYGHLFKLDIDADVWYSYDGQRWCPKALLAVKYQIAMMLPEGLRSSAFVSGVEQLLRCWPDLQVGRKDWNPANHLINTPAGTYDLRTRVMRPHDPADMMTCITSVGPSMEAHPLWSEKLVDWFGAEVEEQAYVQKLAGLFLTGETKDSIIPFWVGPGGDGKSVLTSLFQSILGSYARTSTETAFIEMRNTQHTEEIAWLSEGVRLVIVPEAGGVWAEPRLKLATGGDMMSGAYKHRSVFEFRPRFKLLITSNDPPRIKSGGKAMARRFHVRSFCKPITNPDYHLSEKLRQEAPSILWWMIQGAGRYYEEGGIKPSPAVIEASAEYMLESDPVQQWLDEEAEVGEGLKWHGVMAFESYKEWAIQAGSKHPLDRLGLSRRLKAKGIPSETKSLPGRSNSERCYIGIGPKKKAEDRF